MLFCVKVFNETTTREEGKKGKFSDACNQGRRNPKKMCPLHILPEKSQNQNFRESIFTLYESARTLKILFCDAPPFALSNLVIL